MTPVLPILIFGLVMLAVWAVGIVADVLVGRRVHIPERWTARAVPGWLPAYVRQDFKRARQLKLSAIARRTAR
ncbi:hypothetical protein ACIBAC_29090 [Streptomyces sp. NPDC051362]|uniref:hypothetical protein n=1 Tax=Streptomyces sp. NPDC051362 TaxID=3365651 RepID=UPI00378E81FF